MSKKTEQKLAQKVMLIQVANPKKPNTQSHTRYNTLIRLCKGGATPTVAELLKAGYRMDDVRHDSEHGFIALGDKAIKDAAAAAEKARADAIEAARKLIAEADAAAAKVEA